MGVSIVNKHTIRIIADGQSKDGALANLFDGLGVVSRKYHLDGMEALDRELREKEGDLTAKSRIIAELRAEVAALRTITNKWQDMPPPRCTKLGVIQAMVTLLKDHGKWGSGIGLMELKHAMDRIW